MAPEDSFLLTTAGESHAAFSKIYGAQTQAIALNHMDNVEVTIYNWDAGLHPFHVCLSAIFDSNPPALTDVVLGGSPFPTVARTQGNAVTSFSQERFTTHLRSSKLYKRIMMRAQAYLSMRPIPTRCAVIQLWCLPKGQQLSVSVRTTLVSGSSVRLSTPISLNPALTGPFS